MFVPVSVASSLPSTLTNPLAFPSAFRYLKQQFSGWGLRLLGFDREVLGRVYMSRHSRVSANSSSNSSSSSNLTNNIQGQQGQAVLRTVDVQWDTCTTTTPDASVAVVDGSRLLITPLGRAVVPPPMSMYHAQLWGTCMRVVYVCMHVCLSLCPPHSH
jgi:hypothetical protein